MFPSSAETWFICCCCFCICLKLSIYTSGGGSGHNSSCTSSVIELSRILSFSWSSGSVRGSVFSTHSWCCCCVVATADDESYLSLRNDISEFPFASKHALMLISLFCSAGCGGIDNPQNLFCFFLYIRICYKVMTCTMFILYLTQT